VIPPFTRGDLDLTEALKFDKTELGRRIATLRGYAKAAGRSPDSIELSGNSFVLAARDKSAVEGDGAGDRDRDGGKAQLEGDAVLKAIFSYVASDEAAHAGFYRKIVKIELGADREATVSDFAHVLANFKMPGDGLIPHYHQRLRTGGGGIAARGCSWKLWFRQLCAPLASRVRRSNRRAHSWRRWGRALPAIQLLRRTRNRRRPSADGEPQGI